MFPNLSDFNLYIRKFFQLHKFASLPPNILGNLSEFVLTVRDHSNNFWTFLNKLLAIDMNCGALLMVQKIPIVGGFIVELWMWCNLGGPSLCFNHSSVNGTCLSHQKQHQHTSSHRVKNYIEDKAKVVFAWIFYEL